VPVAPAASCAKCRKHTSVVTTVAPGSPGIPARDGFNRLFRALPGDRACLPPSLADCSANLTPASGRQDHTTSPSALAPFVRAKRLRCVLPRPSHPLPYVRDDRETPLCVGPGCQRCRSDLRQMGTGIFLRRGLDRRTTDLPVRHNHRVRRAPCVVPSSSFPSARSRRRLTGHLGDAAGLIGARDVECGFPDRDLAVAQDPDAALAMSLQADSSARDERMRCCRHNRGRNTTLRKKTADYATLIRPTR
jgi:hypothetical protein